MIHVRGFARSVSAERARLLQLSAVVFVWQAFVGIYFLSLVQQYLPQQLHAGLAYSGYAMAAYGVAKFLCQAPAGWLSDRIGRRVTMLAGVAMSVPALWLMMDIRDERAFLACSALLGLGAATMWPAFMAHVGETTPRGRRNRTMSLLNIAVMSGVGVGTFAGVLLVDYVTYTAVFWLCIAFNALALIMVARGIKDRERTGHEDERRQHAAADPDAWKPSIPVLAVIVLFLTLGTSLHTPMIGAYTKDVLHVKMSSLALLFPAPAALAAILFWRYHRIADRHGRLVPLVLGLGVAAACIFALTLTRNPIIAVNLVVLAGLAYAISVPAWGAAALDATDVGARGLWLGALTAIQGFGVAGGQALGGVIGGVWGPLAPFKIAALLLALALVVIVVHSRTQSRRRGPKIEVPLLAPALVPVASD
jgi:MFS family permease